MTSVWPTLSEVSRRYWYTYKRVLCPLEPAAKARATVLKCNRMGDIYCSFASCQLNPVFPRNKEDLTHITATSTTNCSPRKNTVCDTGSLLKTCGSTSADARETKANNSVVNDMIKGCV